MGLALTKAAAFNNNITFSIKSKKGQKRAPKAKKEKVPKIPYSTIPKKAFKNLINSEYENAQACREKVEIFKNLIQSEALPTI